MGECRWRDWLAEGWRVELAARGAGVAMPEPVPGPKGEVSLDVAADGGPVAVRVHRWVEGARTVPREPVDVPLARWVGATLARDARSRAAPARPVALRRARGAHGRRHVADLVARSRAKQAPWTDALVAASPCRRAAALLERGTRRRGPGHGDVDQNLLLADGGPLLCDWDVVLPLPPAH